MSLWERIKSSMSCLTEWLDAALVPCPQQKALPRIGHTGLVQKGQCYLGRRVHLPLMGVGGDVRGNCEQGLPRSFSAGWFWLGIGAA